MKKRKAVQTILSVLLCAMIIFSLCGCETDVLPYNIKVIKKGGECGIKEDFKVAHRTFAVIIRYDIIDESGTARTIFERDTQSPKERFEIIQDLKSMDNAFSYFNYEVDFETEMIVMLFFTDYNGGPCYVHYANIEGSVLSVQFSSYMAKGTATGIQPGVQNCLLMKMDKHDITEVKRVFWRT